MSTSTGNAGTNFLKLYLAKDRNANRETMRLAESIRAKRALELNSRPHGFIPHFKQRVDFVRYARPYFGATQSDVGRFWISMPPSSEPPSPCRPAWLPLGSAW